MAGWIFPSLVVQLSYWNGLRRQPAGFSFFGGNFSTGLQAGALSVTLSLCRGPPFVGARRSVSGPGAFCVGARRSFFLSGPGALFVSGLGALCVGARRSVCRGPALFVSGPGALSIGLRHLFGARIVSVSKLGRSSASFVSGPSALRRSLCRGPALCVDVCVGARVSAVSETGSLFL